MHSNASYCDFSRTFRPPLPHLFHGVLRYLARLHRYSPRWIAGAVEQRFTGYEFDEARSRGMGFGALSPLSREALAPLPYSFRPRKTKYYSASWHWVPLKWELWCKRRAQLYRLLYNCRNHLFLTASHLFLEEACDFFLIVPSHLFLAEAASSLGFGLQKRSYSTICIQYAYTRSMSN